MTFRLCIVAVTLAAIGFGASRLNRRLRVDRPSPLTLAERYGWEMERQEAAISHDCDALRCEELGEQFAADWYVTTDGDDGE